MLEVINPERFSLMTKDEVRDFIHRLEIQLKELPQLEMPVKHHYSHGVYGRELPIPAGTLLVGEIHKHQTLNVLTKGEMTILSTDGVVRLKAPHVFVSAPGTKRVGFAHEDSTWLTVNHTFETDEDKIKSEVLVKSYDELEEKWRM